MQLYLGEGGRPARRTSPRPPGRLRGPAGPGRGLAAGDLDNDGRVDAVIVSQDEPLAYFHNRTDAGPFAHPPSGGDGLEPRRRRGRVTVHGGRAGPGRRVAFGGGSYPVGRATLGCTSGWAQRRGPSGWRSAGRPAASIASTISTPTRATPSARGIRRRARSPCGPRVRHARFRGNPPWPPPRIRRVRARMPGWRRRRSPRVVGGRSPLLQGTVAVAFL